MDSRRNDYLLTRVRRLALTGTARAIRQAADLSLTEMGELVEVDRTTVWRWEMGQRRPRGDAARRYLTVLEGLSGVRA
jgi:DNA-binding transcriptional regulator YiaG